MKLKTKSKTNKSLIQSLVNIGLTPLESQIYILIYKQSSITVSEIAKTLKILVPSIHRTLKKLKQKDLVMHTHSKPLRLQAVDPAIAISQITHSKQQKLEKDSHTIIQKLARIEVAEDDLKVEFLKSKSEIFTHSLIHVKAAKKEILILSIGEEIPEELFISVTQAAKRGVVVKMLAEKHDHTNHELLSNWIKNGWNVRHLSDPLLDFSLVIFDAKVVVIQVRKSQDLDARVGIAFYNSNYAKAQKAYFDTLWENSMNI